MKFTKKQLTEIVKGSIKQLVKESNDFMGRRELLNKARDASFKFENDIIKTLDLEDPNKMTPEQRKEFLQIMRTMEKRIVKSVAHTIMDLNKMGIPIKKEEPESVPVNPGPGSTKAATPAGTVVTPHHKTDGTGGGL